MAETKLSTPRSSGGTGSAYIVRSTQYPDLFLDFDADDSGAMAHVVDAPRVFPWFGKRAAPVACTRAA